MSSKATNQSKKELNRAVNRNSMKIESFDPSLRKSLLDDINDLENVRIDNPTTLILPGVEEADEEELDLEDFR